MVPRVRGMTIPACLLRLHLTITADFDSAERIAEFVCPSLSRPDRNYVCEVDFISCECACGCEAFHDYRETSRMPYRRAVAGVYTEQVAMMKGKYLAPLITRPPRCLCPHLRLCRRWIKAHGLYEHFVAVETGLLRRLEGMPEPRKASA